VGLWSPEDGDPGLRDDRQVLGPVIDDVDGDPGHLLRGGSDGGESAADVGERLMGLRGQIARADEVALRVVGGLSGDEDQPAPGRGDDVGVALRRVQILGVDELERHRCRPPRVT
jgi:hypothetical protein